MNLLRKKKIIFQGRTGIIFNSNDKKSFYIDSEMLMGKHDIVIYKDSIYELRNNEKTNLNEEMKLGIIENLKIELDKQKIKYVIK
jgi:hypothetical protein